MAGMQHTFEEQIIKEIKRTFEELLKRLNDNSYEIEINRFIDIASKVSGKIYELYALVDVVKELKERKFELELIPINGVIKIPLKPSTLNKEKFSYIKIKHHEDSKEFELWMDIEFIGLSKDFVEYEENISETIVRNNFIHELDIAILDVSENFPDGKRPKYNQVHIAVECKEFIKFRKSILKQILGIRRELSSYVSKNNIENKITKEKTNMRPPSEIWVYVADKVVSNLKYVGSAWNIRFIFLEPVYESSTS